MYSVLFSKRQTWQSQVDNLSNVTGLHSILVMESLLGTMKVVCANSNQDIYHEAEEGPKSVQAGCHELYCERVVNTGNELFVADAAADNEWKGNEDLVKFGLGVYLGLPIRLNGEVVGTVCALHNKPYDFCKGETSARDRLYQLQVTIEKDLMIES
ncbi:MAG: GAF domain-containing protein [Oceanospirillaceae bacterium]